MNVKQQLQELAGRFPNAKVVEISYTGNGDSFDSFYQTEVKEGDLEGKEEEFEDAANGLLWHAIDNSEADFNNDGSCGTIKFDFINMKLSIDNYYYVTEEVPSGEIVFDAEAENEE